ncbi:F-box/LRR-repeat protein 6-like [Rana temporaria]|uniref:F-box/LRR-repeat protein 6-like n=1 Tax=Rana temporaria TaxID=8407 RepID=UPI001AACE0EF|nr:F-box/LRR-repeat protein 6-like [Rana temporaria]XP_040207993.1 F-box/LRR-repeat protein 6-like [Rana temporaria]
MLLLNSNNDLDESVCEQSGGSEEASMDTEDVTTDFCWSSIIPVEILHRVFRLLADSEGAVPILCRLSQVCRLWRQVASSRDLWRRVTVSRCCVLPGITDPPRTQKRVMKTIEALIQQRLPQVSDFSLHQWKSFVSLVLQNLSQSCPLLSSLTLSHCNQVTVEDLLTIGRCCPQLQNLNLQNSKVQFDAVQRFLEKYGARLRRLSLSYSLHMKSIMAGISDGWCPELRLLEVNLPLDSKVMDFQLPIEEFQISCPKLEVLRLVNIPWQAKPQPKIATSTPGFPELQELIASFFYSSVNDAAFQRLLKNSRKLRVLDLRGCYKISPQGLSALPCTDVERLFLGLYCSSMVSSSIVSGSHLLTHKWRHSLQELDLTGHGYLEEDLAEALHNLCKGSGGANDALRNDTLQSLNLSGTRATPHAVRDVLLSCRSLTHLDLSSCRNVPRGLDRVYHGREDIEGCLTDLTQKLQEAEEQ